MSLTMTILVSTERAPVWRVTKELGKKSMGRLPDGKGYEAVLDAAEKEFEKQLASQRKKDRKEGDSEGGTD